MFTCKVTRYCLRLCTAIYIVHEPYTPSNHGCVDIIIIAVVMARISWYGGTSLINNKYSSLVGLHEQITYYRLVDTSLWAICAELICNSCVHTWCGPYTSTLNLGAALSASIFHSFEAGIANAISSFKWRKRVIFINKKNRHLQHWIIGLTEHLPKTIWVKYLINT